jgi:pimeloyl-ACP methyl ester carboxylesterase
MKIWCTLLLILVAVPNAVNAGPSVIAKIPSADGVKIHAESWGETGPVLVFIHGWSCDGSYWRDQIQDLSRDYRVVTVDLAGHGQSEAGRKVYTMEAFGQDVVAVLETWDLRDVTLIGHSMGGAVITEAALAAPNRVLGLIGVDNFQAVNMKLSSQQIEGFTSTFERNFPDFTRQWVSSMFPATADSSLVVEISSDMAAAPPEVGLSAMGELLRWYGGTGVERLAALQVPLLCINSDKEPTDEEAMKALIPRYQAFYLANTGHFLFRENPAAFNRILRDALAVIMPK